LARLLTRGGNRIGAILYDGDRPVTVPAGSGRLHVLRLIHRLQQPHAVHPGPDRPGRCSRRCGCHPAASLVVVVSDFIAAPGWEAPLRLLAQRHDVVPIQIVDPLEPSLPDVGEIVLEDRDRRAGARRHRRRATSASGSGPSRSRSRRRSATASGPAAST
jgi:uncharacterized protein (DUF58 family)